MKYLLLFPLIFIWGLSTSLFAQESSRFYANDHIEEIQITFEQENWKYLLDSLRFNGDGLLEGTVMINGKEYKNVGLCYRDSRSFQPGAKRNGLSLQLDWVNKEQNHQGYKMLELSSALRDPSMVREVLFYETARQYMPAPQANYAKVGINEEFYGLFVNIEAVDEVFLQRHFGSSTGSFFKCNPDVGQRADEGCFDYVYGTLQVDGNPKCFSQNFKNLSDKPWEDLMALSQALKKGTEGLEEVLNIDRTLWMLALNNVMVNLSSYSGQYSQSYYLYKDASGQFNPIVWDVNLSFGSYKNTGIGSDLDLNELQELDPLLHQDNETKPLISTLLSDSYYKKLYTSHLRSILYDHFTNARYESRAVELQEMIQSTFLEDPNKDYTLNDFNQSLKNTIGTRSKIPGIVELMQVRSSFLKKNTALAAVPPQIGEINVMKREKFSRQLVKDFKIQVQVEKFPKTVTLWYRFDASEDFKEVAMYDDGKNNDGKANDQIYGVSIKPEAGKQVLHYYIQAENPRAISFSPANYMFQVHKVNLTELNK